MNSIHAKPYGSAVLESEIVALRKENAALREALKIITEKPRHIDNLMIKADDPPASLFPAKNNHRDTTRGLRYD